MESSNPTTDGKTEVIIFFNNPCLSDVESASQEQDEEVFAQDKQQNTINFVYDLSIRLVIDTYNTIALESLRPLIDEQIKGSLEKQSLPYYFKRNGLSSTPQLKDEKKSLIDLEIGDQSILHLQLGIGCSDGEHMLNFELERSVATEGNKDKSVIIPFGTLPVSEKFTVLQLKTFIFSKWADLSTAVPSALLQGDDEAVVPIEIPQTPSHIRLRDFKGGKQSGPLRDDRILGRCLLGLADGRKLIVQVLQKEEQIAADDILISLRVASYFGDDKALSGQIELPMQRSNTIKHLFERLLAMYPNLQEPIPEELAVPADGTVYSETIPELKYIALARGYSSGPALTLKNSLKLKWNDPTVLKDALTATLDRPPLNLRDGSIIVVRGVADFARAEVIMRQKKQQAALEAEARPVSRGAGAAAVRARLRAQKEAAAAAANASDAPEAGKINISTATATAPVTPSNTSPIVEQTQGKPLPVPVPVPALPSPDKLQAGFSAESVVAADGAALPPPQKSPRA